MFDRHARRRLAPVSLSLAVALGIAACGAPATSVAPSQVATAAPSATAAPTPSPSAADVSAAFYEVISAKDFSGKATLTGTLMIGAVEGDVTGSFAGDDDDSSSTTTITAGTFKQTTDKISVGDERWSRTSPGPWLEDPAKPGGSSSDKSLATTLRNLGSVVDLGVESHAGKQLHHLQPKAGNMLTADDVGFDVGTATDAQFTLDFYATDDGAPASMVVTGSWTQGSGSDAVKNTMTLEYVFSDIGEPQVINPPEDVWVRYTSDLGYTMAHPPDWTVVSKKNQDQYLLNDQPYVYVAVTPYKGSTAKFANELKASYKKPFKGEPESEAATVLGGQPAVRLIYQYRNDEDQDVTIADDVISRDGIGWEVFLATAGGPEDIEVFNQFVATFQFTD